MIVMLDLMVGIGNWWFIQSNTYGELLSWQDYQRLNAFPCIAFGLFYGLYRVGAYHPVFRRNYYDWLMTTPWTQQLELPLGPVQLTGEEAPFVGLAMLLAAGPEKQLIVGVPVAFLSSYVLALTAITYAGTASR